MFGKASVLHRLKIFYILALVMISCISFAARVNGLMHFLFVSVLILFLSFKKL